jgi:hypothetical protein
MELIPPRTSASDLDDDELILFDFLWDKDAPINFLYADIFCLHANTPYSHSISDDQLRSRLLALVERNLLFVSPALPAVAHAWGSEEGFGLTKKGFEAWEAERLPDWSRYINDSWGDNDFTVTAASKQIGIQFIEGCRKSGLLSMAAPEPTYSVEKDVQHFSWKTFDELHYFIIQTSYDESLVANWPLYERDRVWWRVTSELWTPGTTSP